MPREKLSEASKEALRGVDPLSPAQFQEVQSVLTDPSREHAELQASHHVAVQSKLMYDLTAALREMDKTSAALARRLVGLTWILVALTLILAIDPIGHLLHLLHWRI